METLHNLFITVLQKGFSVKSLEAKLFKDKFKEFGILLTNKQIQIIEDLIDRNELTSLKLDFNSDQQELLRGIRKDDHLVLDFSEADFENLKVEIAQSIQETILNLGPELADILYPPMMSNRKKILTEDRKDQKDFQKVIVKNWGRALDFLELFISFNEHIGDEFINSYKVDDQKQEDAKAEVLVRLHARSVQVSREILTLMKNGYADGAYARWRTLYEISVFCAFIQKNESELAERYLDYDAVENFLAADEYQHKYQRLNREPISQEDFQLIERDYKEVLAKYGDDFRKDYGWAREVLKPNRPTFKEIEDSIGYDHLRPLYKRACFNVHAGPRGIMFRMGMHEEADLLLSGSSIYGLYDPGFDTAFSLSLITTDLLSLISTLDSIVYIEILKKFRDEVIQVFGEVEEL